MTGMPLFPHKLNQFHYPISSLLRLSSRYSHGVTQQLGAAVIFNMDAKKDTNKDTKNTYSGEYPPNHQGKTARNRPTNKKRKSLKFILFVLT